MSVNLILSLQDVSLAQGNEFGWKASTLGEVLRSGMKVPEGVVIGASVFENIIRKGILNKKLSIPLGEHFSGMNQSLQVGVYKNIEDFIISDFFRSEVSSAVSSSEKILSLLKNKNLIVRSSSPNEDLDGASFAGLYESYPGITNQQQLIEAVIKCVQSACQPKLIEYISKGGGALELPKIGVLIQIMVEASASGVAFSRDPLSEDSSALVIQASTKGTDAVTSGSDKGYQIRAVRFGKGFKILSRESTEIAEELGIVPLMDIVDRLEKHWGKPQDIEWAKSGEHIFILQTRPVTGFSKESFDRSGTEIVFWKSRCKELYPGAFVPLNIDLVQRLTEGAYKWFFESYYGLPYFAPVYHCIRGRFFMDRTNRFQYYLLRDSKFQLPFWKRIGWRVSLDILLDSFSLKRKMSSWKERISELRSGDLGKSNFQEIVAEISELLELSIDISKYNLLYVNFYEEEFSKIQKKLSESMAKRLSANELVDMARKTYLSDGPFDSMKAMGRKMSALPSYTRVREILKNSASGEEKIDQLRGLGASESAIAGELDDFFLHFGYRGAIDTNIYFPSWDEDKNGILNSILTFAEKAGDQSKDSHAAHQVQDAGFDKMIFRVGLVLQMRESLRTLWTTAFRTLRPRYLELGRRFIAGGLISAIDDIFFLKFDEVKWAASNQNLWKKNYFRKEISYRREIFEENRKRAEKDEFIVLPECFIDGDLSVMAIEPKDSVRGLVACKGMVEGKAWIVNDPNSDKIPDHPEDYIFILPILDRGAWPWLASAKGLIVDSGGILSHGAILARELGLPCLIGTDVAAKNFRNDEKIILDAINGNVHRSQSDVEERSPLPMAT